MCSLNGNMVPQTVPPELREQQRQAMLQLALATLDAMVENKPLPPQLRSPMTSALPETLPEAWGGTARKLDI